MPNDNPTNPDEGEARGVVEIDLVEEDDQPGRVVIQQSPARSDGGRSATERGSETITPDKGEEP